MYCTHCGHQNPPDANFCGQCGRPLARAADGTTGVLPVEDTEVSPDTPVRAEDLGEVADLAPGTAMLVATGAANQGARFLLDQDVITVGRHPDSDIFLDDITVSRRHAELRRSGGRYRVHDVGSLNGTYVNGQRTDERDLTTGDEVQIGKFKLVALMSEADQ